MKELKRGRDSFSRFRKPQKLIRLLDDVAAIIIDSDLMCRSIAIHKPSFHQTAQPFDMETNIYSFGLFMSALTLGTIALNRRPRDPSLRLIMDRVEKGPSLVAEAERIYSEDQSIAWRGWPIVTTLPSKNPTGSKDLPGLQMADVIAWIARNELLCARDWFETIKPQLGENNFELWDRSLDNWLVEQANRYPGDKLDFIKFRRVSVHLEKAERVVAYKYDSERLKNHIFLNRHLPPPEKLRQSAIEQCGRFFPLTH